MAKRKAGPITKPGTEHAYRKSRLTLSLDDARATLIDMARLWHANDPHSFV
jgi:hypothetical protein